MYTWGISGRRFLLLYLVLLAVTVLGVVLARRRALAADGAAVPARLDPYEAAELNGGGFLVATTAVSCLLRKGSLTSSSRRRNQPARLVAATAPGPGAHPVEWAVYQQVAASPNRRLKDVRSASGCSWAGWPRPPSSGPGAGPPCSGSCPCSPSGWPGWRPGRPMDARSASWSPC